MKAYTHLFLALGLFLAAIGGYWLWYGGLSARNAEVAALAGQLAAQNATEAEARAASAELGKLGADESAIGAYFVDPNNIVSFLEGLQETGSKLGSKVSVISVSAASLPRPSLNLALTATGSFDAVLRTAGAIEYAPYDIRVTGLTLDSSAADAAGAWTAAVTLTVGTATSTATTTP